MHNDIDLGLGQRYHDLWGIRPHYWEVTPMSNRFTNAAWHKSSRSNGNGGNNCVEVATDPEDVGVRDSKDSGGPILRFSPAAWESFISNTKLGAFDLTS